MSSLIPLPSTLQHIVPCGSQRAGSRRLFPHPLGACTAPCSTAHSRWRAAARAAHIQNPTGPTAADRLASKNDLQFLSWLLPFFFKCKCCYLFSHFDVFFHRPVSAYRNDICLSYEILHLKLFRSFNQLSALISSAIQTKFVGISFSSYIPSC